jgi:hypothetical protein
MVLIDCVIFNKDRHTGNYGYLVDSNTFKVLNFAPIYDHNYALFPDISLGKINKSNWVQLNNTVRSRFNNESFLSLSGKVLRDYKDGRDLLLRLKQFRFKYIHGMDKRRFKKLNLIIQSQIDLILKLNK